MAEHIVDGELPVGELAELPDEKVYEVLIAVKGLGRWSIDMFLMFHLGRPDVRFQLQVALTAHRTLSSLHPRGI